MTYTLPLTDLRYS